MESSRATVAALDAAGSLVLKGRQLRIAEAYEDPQAGRRQAVARLSERVFVGNLPFSMDEAGVRQVFRAHELEPAEIFIARDKKTGEGRGFSFVTMSSIDDAGRAIGALNEALVGGRRLVVRPANPRPEKGGDRPPNK